MLSMRLNHLRPDLFTTRRLHDMGRLTSVISSVAFAGLSLFLIATSAHAALDLPESLKGLGSTNVATVVLVPPMAVFQNPLSPTGLQSNGCHYTTVDRAAIRALVAMLQSAEVTANPVYQKADVREGTYFTLDDGRKVSLLIADNGTGRLPVMGLAEVTNGGQIQSVSFSAKSTLSREVREWAKRYGGAGSGTGCDLQTGTAEDPTAPPPIPR
jgi:hypothetical protein